MSESISIYTLLKVMRLTSYEKIALAKNLISEFNFNNNYEEGKEACLLLVKLLNKLEK